MLTEAERLRAALNYIRLRDWGWFGGGSDVRVHYQYGTFAAKALGVHPGLPDGWPSESERQECEQSYRRALSGTETARATGSK